MIPDVLNNALGYIFLALGAWAGITALLVKLIPDPPMEFFGEQDEDFPWAAIICCCAL